MNRKGKTVNIVEKEITILLTSSEKRGATNLNSTKNAWHVNIQDDIDIPKETIYCYLTVPEVTNWYNTPNISVLIGNNVMYYEYLTTDYTITIPDGLYDLDHLNQIISNALTNQAGVPNDLFEIIANTATEKVSIHFNYATTQVDFTQSNTPRLVLGFNSRLSPLGLTTVEVYEEADNAAAFNSLDYYLLKCDIISKGIRINSDYDRVISRVLIDVPPGSQNVQRKRNPEKIDCSELSHQKIRSLNVRFTDQDGKDVETLGEEITALLVIHYSVPVWH